jgi:diacylglycerol kinase (ATP)
MKGAIVLILTSQKEINGYLQGADHKLLINSSKMSESIPKFLKSFSNAIHGITILFKSQINARIELIISVLVVIMAILFKITAQEWIFILLCIALVLGLEGINTAIEIFSDKVHPGIDTEIGKAKDVAAGAVLIASIVAAIIGFIIFAPRILDFFLN